MQNEIAVQKKVKLGMRFAAEALIADPIPDEPMTLLELLKLNGGLFPFAAKKIVNTQADNPESWPLGTYIVVGLANLETVLYYDDRPYALGDLPDKGGAHLGNSFVLSEYRSLLSNNHVRFPFVNQNFPGWTFA